VYTSQSTLASSFHARKKFRKWLLCRIAQIILPMIWRGQQLGLPCFNAGWDGDTAFAYTFVFGIFWTKLRVFWWNVIQQIWEMWKWKWANKTAHQCSTAAEALSWIFQVHPTMPKCLLGNLLVYMSIFRTLAISLMVLFCIKPYPSQGTEVHSPLK